MPTTWRDLRTIGTMLEIQETQPIPTFRQATINLKSKRQIQMVYGIHHPPLWKLKSQHLGGKQI